MDFEGINVYGADKTADRLADVILGTSPAN